MDEFANATEKLFERIFRSISRNQKLVVERERLQHWRAQTKALKHRIQRQNLELAQLTGVLAAIDEGVILQDTRGQIVLMNEAARYHLGSQENFWESPLAELFRHYVNPVPNPDAAGQIDPLIEPQRLEINDKILGVNLAAVYSADGNLLGTVMLLSDVANQSLAEKLKTSFITQMSHELLTPLTSIKGMSDLLLNLPDGRPPDRRFLETISRNVAIMDRMIVELLDISEISAGSFTIRHDPLNLGRQVDYILQGFAAQARKAKVEIAVQIARLADLEFLGDSRRIQWAIGHIIDNGLKYTEPNGRVLLEFFVEPSEIVLKVRDTGVGISPDDLPYIFDRFYRGKALTPSGKLIDPRGLGQGLYVAKAVIMAHDGNISVASKLGEGSVFTIRLPRHLSVAD
jgi:two-component system sensor histidine kinase ResE